MPRQTYAALLRGINLGARNKVSMADLKELFAALDAEDIETYLRSGNVVFKSAASPQLANEIEKRISRDLGLDISVLLRTNTELQRIVADNPFAGKGSDLEKLHVTFLAEAPKRAVVAKIDADGFAPDEFQIIRGEVYLRCPNGYGRSKLSNAFFEKRLGVAATTRNWKTVTKLAELTNG
jgi:uncharacterized protein (DUF1697 family)